MNADRTIPIVIGVTGHREIAEKDRPAILASVTAELKKLQVLCPHSELVMLSSLAEGGDLLCADAAETLGIPLIAVLPRDCLDYAKDFSEAGAKQFTHHFERASRFFIAPQTEPVPREGPTRGWQFRQAGICISNCCHVLLALWDGGPGTEAACGTAETVDFALRGCYEPDEGMAVRSEANTSVIHIFTPREGRNDCPAGTVRILGNETAVREILLRTDEFNALAAQTVDEGSSRLPGTVDDSVLMKIERIGKTAGRLSSFYAGRYRLILALLAIISALIAFSFLLYDEVHAIGMILACGLLLLAAFACRWYAGRSDCHRRYIEYRALAECLRVQTYLRYAGSRIRTEQLLTWTQREETAWILAALCALGTAEEPCEEHDIRTCWVETQREYHREAALRSGHDLDTSERIVRTALILSVLLYSAAVVYELFCGGLLFSPHVTVRDVEFWRTFLKIAMGTITVVTLFTANYYGRLSLPRRLSDHKKMERFYEQMSETLCRQGQNEEVLRLLAREELIENGNWSSYQRDNAPDISL